MGIRFEKKRKIFHLYTKKYSYYIHVNKLKYLIHLYDGKYLDDISKERVSERYMERYAYLKDGKEICDEDYYFSFYGSNFEVSSFMKGDKRTPFIIIEDKNHYDLTNFLFSSFKIINGVEKKNMMYPHVRFNNKDAQTLIITLKEEHKNVYLKLYYEVSEKYDCIVRYAKLINKEKEDIYVKKMSVAELDLPSSDYTILATHGTWGNDREIEYIPLSHSLTKISENHGSRGFAFNPALFLKKNDATFEYGEAYAFMSIYSGDFSYEFKMDEIDQSRVIMGYNDETCQFLLKHNEEIETFELIEAFTSQGINDLTHRLHNLLNDKVIREFKGKKDYILINSWEGLGFKFDTEKIINLIDEAKKVDIDLVVIDDGWFKGRDDDTSSLGDWEVYKEKIDLHKVLDYAKNQNMNMGIWVEPEMISPKSDLYKNHPEFVLNPKALKNPTLLRHQLVLDLSNDEVIDYIFKELCKIFDEYKFQYVKWDFNRFLTESYSQNLIDEGRSKESHDKFIKGSYKLLYKFIKKYPNILLETCASGGGRFDASMLYYSTQIWGSDETDIVTRSSIQFATNLFYPLSTIGSHVSARKIGSIQDKACLAFFGTYGYELDLIKLNDDDKNKIKEFNGLYHSFHHIIDKGDYYSIFNPTTSNYVSWNIVTKNKKECLVYFTNLKKETTKSRFIKIKGLKKDEYYFNSLTNDIYKGSFYMNVGLNLSAPLEVFTGMMFVIKQVDDVRATLYRKVKQSDGGKRDKLM